MTLLDQAHDLRLLAEFPLLPCGPTPNVPSGKAPINPDTGFNLSKWENTSYTPEDLLNLNGNSDRVTSVGINHALSYRDGFCNIDLDGQSTLDKAKTFGCSSTQPGWVIGRDTTKERLKVPFFIPEDLRHHFSDANGTPVGKVVLTTKQAEYDLDPDGKPKRDAQGKLIKLKDSEQIELFWSTGQTVVLGQHIPSGGQYTWTGKPTATGEPTPEWWAFILHILEEGQKQSKPHKSNNSNAVVIQSGPAHPCPTCGRDTSGACTQYTDSDRIRINCFEGQSFNPIDAHGTLINGQTIAGSDGKTYAFSGSGFNGAIGSFAKFVEHVERPQQKLSGNDGRLAIAATPAQILHAETLDELLGPVENNKLRRPRTDLLTKVLDLALPLQFNLLTQRIENAGAPIDGDFLGTLYIQLAERFQIEVSKNRASDAAVLQARRNSYHPVQNYLSSLNTSLQPHQWDELAFEIFGITDRAVTLHLQKQLIGLVARAITPGAKLDTALVIHSPKQGIGKSTMWSILGGPWFSDSLGDLRNLKDDILQLHSAWIHEWGEIDAVVGKRESETLKKFLSATKDDVRKPYGRGVESLVRSCGIVGTTNRSDFIKDPTGNRRFPVISVDRVNTDWVQQNRDAIWGSALNAFNANAPWHYDGAENVQITRAAQAYSAEDPLRDQIETWMDDNPSLTAIAMPVIVYQLNPERLRDQEFSRQVSLRLTALGWSKSNKRERGRLPNGDRHDKATVWTIDLGAESGAEND